MLSYSATFPFLSLCVESQNVLSLGRRLPPPIAVTVAVIVRLRIVIGTGISVGLAPIFWGVAFIIVNGVRIVTLTLARRPVILSNKEEELHRVAFASVDKRDFLKMACLARWVDFSPGEVIAKKGHRISEAIVLISGEAEGVLSGKTILTYRPGQLIGNVSAYSGLVCPMDVVARRPARLATWHLEHMREFTESRPELRAKLLQIMSTDLAAKLHESITIKQVDSESFLIGSK